MDCAPKRNPRARFRRAAALALAFVLLPPVAAFGQKSTTTQRKTAPGPTGKLSGQVLDADGKPAVKASVYCQSSDGRSPRATKTDAQGHFRLTCPSGPVDVRATTGETSSEWIRNVRIRTGETTSLTIRISVPPDSGQEKKEKPETQRN